MYSWNYADGKSDEKKKQIHTESHYNQEKNRQDRNRIHSFLKLNTIKRRFCLLSSRISDVICIKKGYDRLVDISDHFEYAIVCSTEKDDRTDAFIAL